MVTSKSERDVRERAERVAIAGLAFLASDLGRLQPFLDLTGLDPGDLRAAAAAPGFLAGVLDHIATDESLLLAFAANSNLEPVEISRARAVLGGPQPDWGP
jgi:Protein of unknown function (DUF3572)